MAIPGEGGDTQEIKRVEPTYRPAEFLLRFDDLCPTHSRSGWAPFEALIREFALKPILAVVPDNRDPELEIDAPDPEFWARMRALEAGGAAIALHGYQHLCRSRGRSLIPLHRETEFAGVAAALQRQWIGAGLGILRAHGLNPRVWVAPRHGIDRATVAALRSEGIQAISDGLARMPFTRGGVTWLPQQLWEPVEKRRGLWTICLHPNTAGPGAAERLRAFLVGHGSRFTSLDAVLAQASPVPLGLMERTLACMAAGKIRLRRIVNARR
jgi:predicted deacetylase